MKYVPKFMYGGFRHKIILALFYFKAKLFSFF